MPRQHVFGYGSLINSGSRATTAPDAGECFPVNVRGLARGWWIRHATLPMSGLGTVLRAGAETNGVIFEVTDEGLAAMDGRELPHGYRRVKVLLSDLSPIELPMDSIVWAYLAVAPSLPDAVSPISQSYVDVTLSGCLEYGESFAESFVRTTADWDSPWVDDRNAPRYTKTSGDIAKIDEILERVVPAAFDARYRI